MPFIPEPQNPGDPIRAGDWNDLNTAVTQLFARFHQATGHGHTGTEEDGPPIGSAALAAGAVTTPALANASVTAAKLADGAVTGAKLAPGAVTADKLAIPVPREIGVAVAQCVSNGQSLPIPTGFSRQECIF